MEERNKFQIQMELLKKKAGTKAEARAYQTFEAVLIWLCQYGHGKVELNAIDHRFGEKIKAETLFTLKNPDK